MAAEPWKANLKRLKEANDNQRDAKNNEFKKRKNKMAHMRFKIIKGK